MKVSIDRVLNHYNTMPGAKRTEGKGSGSSVTDRKFDEIVINTDARTVAESQFADQQSRKLAAGLREQTPESKIIALRDQTEQGNYKIDTEAITSKIFLQAEDN